MPLEMQLTVSDPGIATAAELHHLSRFWQMGISWWPTVSGQAL
jgi:hypothetical protein